MSSEDEAEYERKRQEVLRKEKGVVHANLVCNRDTDPDSVMGCQLMRIRRHDVTINSLEFNDLTKIGLEIAVYNDGYSDDKAFKRHYGKLGFGGDMDSDMAMLGQDVAACTGIRSLLIRSTSEIFEDDDYFLLLEEMSVSRSINELHLDGFTFDDQMHSGMLAVFSMRNLSKLDVVCCNMTESSSAIFIDTIEEACPNISILTFKNCLFDEGVDVELVRFLGTLESLTSAEFFGCLLSEDAKHALFRDVRDRHNVTVTVRDSAFVSN